MLKSTQQHSPASAASQSARIRFIKSSTARLASPWAHASSFSGMNRDSADSLQSSRAALCPLSNSFKTAPCNSSHSIHSATDSADVSSSRCDPGSSKPSIRVTTKIERVGLNDLVRTVVALNRICSSCRSIMRAPRLGAHAFSWKKATLLSIAVAARTFSACATAGPDRSAGVILRSQFIRAVRCSAPSSPLSWECATRCNV
mmetsp:Transcript_27682/g.49403  ORF Transcript_27682/g.49403 Transcript_27682/m.49403 type:complete len:202 (+) Transcript_27682:424-1029(+)